FDRQRTLFILPVGMLEEHGPHLPIGADTIGVVYEANGTVTRVSRALPDWNIVMMPSINYGQSGANHLGDMPIHPGTDRTHRAGGKHVRAWTGSRHDTRGGGANSRADTRERSCLRRQARSVVGAAKEAGGEWWSSLRPRRPFFAVVVLGCAIPGRRPFAPPRWPRPG